MSVVVMSSIGVLALEFGQQHVLDGLPVVADGRRSALALVLDVVEPFVARGAERDAGRRDVHEPSPARMAASRASAIPRVR
jgi:hypothetical protein